MKNRQGRGGAILRTRLAGSAALGAVRAGALQLGVGVLTALLARVQFAAGLYPFGLAMVVGVSDRFVAAALAGFVLNNWLGSFSAANTVYIAAVGVVAALRWILAGLARTAYRRDSYLPSLVAAGLTVMFTEAAVMLLAGSFTLPAFGKALGGLGVAGAFSYFYHVSCDALRRRRSIPEFSSAQKACLALSLASVLMALYPVALGPFSLGRVAACAAAAAAAYVVLSPFDVIVFGAAAGALALSEPAFAFAAAGIGAAGALASLFKKRGRALVCLVFVLAAGVFAVCAPSYTYALVYCAEVLFGALAFLVLPLRSAADVKFELVSERLNSATAAVGAKLSCISSSMRDIGTLLDKTVDLTDARCNTDRLYSHVAEVRCKRCPLMSHCWVKHYGDTADALNKLTPALLKKSRVQPEDVPPEFAGRCVDLPALLAEINRAYKAYLDYLARIRSTQLYKGLLKKQFSAVANMLDSAQAELCAVKEWDEQRSRRVYDCAVRLGLPVESASLVYGFARRPLLTVTLTDSPTPQMLKRLTAGLTMIAGVRLSPPKADSARGGTVLTWAEQPDYAVRTGAAQLSAEKEACGDVYSVFTDLRGNVHLLLSDGMGTGKAAARDGATCCAFLQRLLESGFPIRQAAELANSALALREDNESASTLDVLSFDVFTGSAVLFKAGAAPTYCLHGSKVQRIAGRSIPVGILETVVSREIPLSLADGDILVMASDGAERADDPYIEQTLKLMYDETPEAICGELTARAKSTPGAGDDVTILVAKISKC